tara:strand:+ start:1307 stop:1615 length:309 start_codon:yes stop_codon:yes gene_type:complete
VIIIVLFIKNNINNSQNIQNIQNIQNKTNKKADNIIINFFIKQLKNNNNLSLDKCILLFENSEYDNLKDFSDSKMRTVEGYRNNYEKYYKKAKYSIINHINN